MKIVGKGMLRLHAAIPLQSMVMGVIIFVTALVWLSTGFVGIGVLIVGTILGLMPPRIGIRRSHGMGIILVPIMIYLCSDGRQLWFHLRCEIPRTKRYEGEGVGSSVDAVCELSRFLLA